MRCVLRMGSGFLLCRVRRASVTVMGTNRTQTRQHQLPGWIPIVFSRTLSETSVTTSRR